MRAVRRLVSFSESSYAAQQCYAGREVILIDHDFEAVPQDPKVAMMKAKDGVHSGALRGQPSLKRKNIFLELKPSPKKVKRIGSAPLSLPKLRESTARGRPAA